MSDTACVIVTIRLLAEWQRQPIRGGYLATHAIGNARYLTHVLTLCDVRPLPANREALARVKSDMHRTRRSGTESCLETALPQIEAVAYAHDLPERTWLAQLGSAIRPILDKDGLGIASGFYECPDPCSLHPTLIISEGASDEMVAVIKRGVATMSPAYVAATFLGNGIGPGSYYRGWDTIQPVRDRSLQRLGLMDTSAIRFADLDGRGLWFGSFRKHFFHPKSSEWRALVRVRRIVGTAFRLRQKLAGQPLRVEEADTALDQHGRVVQHKTGSLDPALREQLGERARRMRPRAAPQAQAHADAHGLAWLSVEHEAPDGRPYVLAHRLGPSVRRNIALLSGREREVLGRAAVGCSSKVIAFELGLAPSTVRVLLARAATKLGASSREELLRRANELMRTSGL